MTVSTDDVAALLGRDLTSAEDDRAGRLFDIAVSVVEAALPGFSFETGTETAAVNWHDPNVIWTPRYPVSAINKISIDQIPVDLTWVRWDQKGKIELNDVAGDWVINRIVPWGWATVAVDYHFGLDPPPPILAGVVASMVAGVLRRQATNPGNVQSETIGSYSVRYGTQEQAAAEKASASAGMTLPELPNRWKRVAVASVPFQRYR